MTRHVAYVQPRWPLLMPWYRRRRRRILDELAERYPALREVPPYSRTPTRAFAFPASVSAVDAKAKLARHLDGIDPHWRRVLKVWDGFDRR